MSSRTNHRREKQEKRTKRKFIHPSTSRAPPEPPFSSSPSSSSPTHSPPDEAAPWPRNPTRPIRIGRTFPDPAATVINHKCKHRRRTDSWDAYDSLFYNAWLCVDIEPTHVLHETTVKRFGFLPDLEDVGPGYGPVAD